MSVIAQCDDVSVEILIGDDRSSDKTPAIIEGIVDKYPDIIRYIRYTERLGYGSKNLFNLIKKAQGDYIAHLDGDDYWMPGKLKAQIEFMESNPDCSAVYTNALVVKEDNTPVGLFNNNLKSVFNIDQLIAKGNFLNNSSMLYKMSCRTRILDLDPPFLDFQLSICHALSGPIGYINQALVGYRLGSTSSVLVNANDRTRSLYWASILNIPHDRVSRKSLAGCMAEFGRSVFFRTVRVGKISLLRQWVPIILNESPVGKLKMILLVITAIFRVAFQEIISFMCSKVSRNHLKIFYRR